MNVYFLKDWMSREVNYAILTSLLSDAMEDVIEKSINEYHEGEYKDYLINIIERNLPSDSTLIPITHYNTLEY